VLSDAVLHRTANILLARRGVIVLGFRAPAVF